MDSLVVSELINQLKKYVKMGLETLDSGFKEVPYDCCGILSRKEILHLGELNPFDRQVELKRKLEKKLHGSFSCLKINKWIVQKWGGIPRFNVSNQERIDNFSNNLHKGEITAKEFNRISSLSKIASFVNSQCYFIFDSRVAFSLNGLLLIIHQINPQLPVRFFPMPSAKGGRNLKMKKYIHLLVPNAIYLSKQNAYVLYNALILSLYDGLSAERSNSNLPAFWVEMLLFELGKTNGKIAEECENIIIK